MNMMNTPPQGLDSGGFLSGLLKTILSSSGGGNDQEGVIYNIFQFHKSVQLEKDKTNFIYHKEIN